MIFTNLYPRNILNVLCFFTPYVFASLQSALIQIILQVKFKGNWRQVRGQNHIFGYAFEVFEVGIWPLFAGMSPNVLV